MGVVTSAVGSVDVEGVTSAVGSVDVEGVTSAE